MRRLKLALIASFLLGCGDGNDGGTTTTLSHAFEPVTLEAGGELSWECQSWTLNNPEPLWVNAVRSDNDGFWHHSNWFFVPDTFYTLSDGSPGDGTWPCDERGFEELEAGVAGGVLFAQSTQSTEDVQEFPANHAFRIPAHSQVVGNIHLLNLSDTEITSGIRFEIDTIPAEEVATPLQPMAFFNRAIALPPNQDSEFTMECTFDEPQRFGVHYVMPHYHELGTGIRLELVGGDRDGEVIFQTDGRTGEAWGESLDPAEDMAGATGLRFTCAYSNPRNEVVEWGIGDQEMCVFLAYTDSPEKHAGETGDSSTNEEVDEVDGVSLNEAPCDLASFVPAAD
ncbi:MAG: hypothetical protein ACOC97_04735 [Myxococcota bacterium]